MPTKLADDGSVVARTYGDLELNSEDTMDKLMVLMGDLLDGDDDNSTALRISLELYKKEAVKLGIFTRLKLKMYHEAEAAAMKLVAANPTLLKR